MCIGNLFALTEATLVLATVAQRYRLRLAPDYKVEPLPIFTLLLLLGVLRKPAWMASVAGLAAAVLVAAGVYGMPVDRVLGSITFGAASGLFPIGWVVFSAILLYRVTLESGKFEVLKDSIGHLTDNPKLQALLIAFVSGGVGLGVAYGICALVNLLPMPDFFAGLLATWRSGLLAFGLLGTIAVLSALYPARRAASIDPIEALRYEAGG